MTVLDEYADILNRLEKVEDWQDPWDRPFPLLGFVMHDAIEAITELAKRCQAAEDNLDAYSNRG